MRTILPIAGFCEPQFTAVRLAFEKNFREFDDIGGAVAIYQHQKPVVDLWGGYADPMHTKLWQRHTLVNVWSVTKAIVALCALRLVDRNELDLDTPVAHYWPEFAQAEKEEVLVRELLNHQAGLAAIAEPLPVEAIFDWQRMTDALAKQRPWWKPGTAHGYHAPTFGWLVGELVRRVSHKQIGVFLQDEIARPLGIDFLLGFTSEQDERVATVVDLAVPAETKGETGEPIDPNSVLAKVNNPPLAGADFSIFNSRAWRAAELPSANGTTNARALARIYGALACGGVLDGIQVLSQDLLNHATAVASEGIDWVFGFHNCIGLGFGLNRPAGFMGPHETAFGHGGYGGSLGFADPTAGIGFGFVTNGIAPAKDKRTANLLRALYQSL